MANDREVSKIVSIRQAVFLKIYLNSKQKIQRL